MVLSPSLMTSYLRENNTLIETVPAKVAIFQHGHVLVVSHQADECEEKDGAYAH